MVMKTVEEARANLENSIGYIPARYEAGVNKADWFTPAASPQAETNYAAGVTRAVTNKTRQKAIRKLSNEVWKTGAITKGAPRIGEAIRGSLDKYATNFGAVYSGIVSLVPTLPPRTTDYIANIDNRLKAVVKQWKKGAGKL